jgi:hypothetical protein
MDTWKWAYRLAYSGAVKGTESTGIVISIAEHQIAAQGDRHVSFENIFELKKSQFDMI